MESWMKRLLMVGMTTLIAFVGGFEAEAGAAAEAAFERIKTLEGDWQGTTPTGKPASLHFEVIAGGHAVLEEYAEGSNSFHGMYTVYHLDGDTLMLTHYCVSNNQPRMRAQLDGAEANVLRFEMFDATNLQDPNAGHMVRAVYRFVDPNTIQNAWTYDRNGKEAFTNVVDWKRVP